MNQTGAVVGWTRPAARRDLRSPAATGRSSARDLRLDALRGIFIVSMVFGHLAFGSAVSDAIHPFRWVDGAFGFVFLSGLVIALTRRRQIARGEIRDAHAWIGRRTLTLWMISSALTGGALALKAATNSPTFMWPAVADAGDVVAKVPGVVGLETQPEYLDILPLYVVLLLLAQPALWLLRTRGPLPVLALSLVVYTAAELGLLDHVPADAPTLRWPAWQLLFLGGMAVGWCWPSVDAWHRRHFWMVTIAAVPPVILLFLAAHGRLSWIADTFNKEELSPTTVIAGLSVVVCLLAAVGALLATPCRTVLAGVAVIGRHSRGCFITLTAVHVVWLTAGHPASLAASSRLSVAAAALVACAIVAWLSDRRDARSSSIWRRPSPALEAAA